MHYSRARWTLHHPFWTVSSSESQWKSFPLCNWPPDCSINRFHLVILPPSLHLPPIPRVLFPTHRNIRWTASVSSLPDWFTSPIHRYQLIYKGKRHSHPHEPAKVLVLDTTSTFFCQSSTTTSCSNCPTPDLVIHVFCAAFHLLAATHYHKHRFSKPSEHRQVSLSQSQGSPVWQQ